MPRYLLFDSGCSVCTGLAQEIERMSGDRLAIRSLRDPEIQTLLSKANSNWKWEPTLLEVEDETVNALTGLGLRTRMVATLGPRQAWRVANLLHRFIRL